MGIHPADAAPRQPPPLDERHHVVVRGDRSGGQSSEVREDLRAMPKQGSAGQLANDERVGQDLVVTDQNRQRRIGPPEVIDPNGAVNQNHAWSSTRPNDADVRPRRPAWHPRAR